MSFKGYRLMEMLYLCTSIPSSSSVKTAVSVWIHSCTAVCNNYRFYFLCLQSLYNCRTSFFHWFLSFDCHSWQFSSLTLVGIVFFVCPVGVVPLLASDHCVAAQNCSRLSSWCRWWCNKSWFEKEMIKRKQPVMPVFLYFQFLHNLQVESMAEMQLLSSKFQFPVFALEDKQV